MIFTMYNDQARHRAKYFKTLKGLKDHLRALMNGSKEAYLVGDNWKLDPLISLAPIIRGLKDRGQVTLQTTTIVDNHTDVWRIKKIEFCD